MFRPPSHFRTSTTHNLLVNGQIVVFPVQLVSVHCYLLVCINHFSAQGFLCSDLSSLFSSLVKADEDDGSKHNNANKDHIMGDGENVLGSILAKHYQLELYISLRSFSE